MSKKVCVSLSAKFDIFYILMIRYDNIPSDQHQYGIQKDAKCTHCVGLYPLSCRLKDFQFLE